MIYSIPVSGIFLRPPTRCLAGSVDDSIVLYCATDHLKWPEKQYLRACGSSCFYMAISSRTNLSCTCVGKKYLLLMKNFQSETNLWRFTPLIGMTSKGFPRGLISYFLLFLPLEFTYHLCFRTPKGLLRMGTSTSYGCRNVILMSNKWMFLFDRSRSLLIIY